MRVISDWMGEELTGGGGDEVFVEFMGPSAAETHILDNCVSRFRFAVTPAHLR